MTTRNVTHLAGLAGLVMASLLLPGCAFLAADSCADRANLPPADLSMRGCNGGFLSAERKRETGYRGDGSPRLWTGPEFRPGATVDVGRVNQGPAARGSIAAWSGSLKVEVPADEAAATRDVADIRSAGTAKFDPDEKVAV